MRSGKTTKVKIKVKKKESSSSSSSSRKKYLVSLKLWLFTVITHLNERLIFKCQQGLKSTTVQVGTMLVDRYIKSDEQFRDLEQFNSEISNA